MLLKHMCHCMRAWDRGCCRVLLYRRSSFQKMYSTGAHKQAQAKFPLDSTPITGGVAPPPPPPPPPPRAATWGLYFRSKRRCMHVSSAQHGSAASPVVLTRCMLALRRASPPASRRSELCARCNCFASIRACFTHVLHAKTQR